jgi:integrase/recombinase XerC
MEHLTTRSVGRILHDACVAKGIDPLHPHQLRHACATHMLDNGAPLVVIQKLLGNEKLSTTALFAFVSPKLMQRTYDEAHSSARVA